MMYPTLSLHTEFRLAYLLRELKLRLLFWNRLRSTFTCTISSRYASIISSRCRFRIFNENNRKNLIFYPYYYLTFWEIIFCSYTLSIGTIPSRAETATCFPDSHNEYTFSNTSHLPSNSELQLSETREANLVESLEACRNFSACVYECISISHYIILC